MTSRADLPPYAEPDTYTCPVACGNCGWRKYITESQMIWTTDGTADPHAIRNPDRELHYLACICAACGEVVWIYDAMPRMVINRITTHFVPCTTCKKPLPVAAAKEDEARWGLSNALFGKCLYVKCTRDGCDGRSCEVSTYFGSQTEETETEPQTEA